MPPEGPPTEWGWIVAALIAVVALYLLARTLVYTLRLTAVLGLSLLAAAATWWVLTWVESALGPAGRDLFLYRWLEPLHVPISLTKLVASTALGLLALWRLTRP